MRIKITVLLAIVMTFTGCGASSVSDDGQAQSSRQDRKAAEFEKVAALIESGSYCYTARTANPTGGRSVQLTSEYTMEAKEGSYEAYLPYFGRAHQASYGGDGGIEFKGEPGNLQISRNESKGTISVAFVMQGDKDQYTVTLEIGDSGYGTLVVSSQKRQSISYYGVIGELGH